jgi:hypothetical protein
MIFATLGGVMSGVSNGPGCVEDRDGATCPGYSSTSCVTEVEIKLASATISAIPFGEGVDMGEAEELWGEIEVQRTTKDDRHTTKEDHDI